MRLHDKFTFIRHDEYAVKQFAEMVSEVTPTRSKLKTIAPAVLGPNPSFVAYVVSAGWKDPSCVYLTNNSACIISSEADSFNVPMYSNSLSPILLPTNTTVGNVMRIEDVGNATLPTDSIKLWKPFTLAELPTGVSLTIAQRSHISQLVNSYRRAFAVLIYELGCTDLVQMKIEEKPDSVPCAQKPYCSTLSDSRALSDSIE